MKIANNPNSHFLVNIDYNEVLGHTAIGELNSVYRETAPLKEFWVACIDYSYENDVVILADMSVASSQIWRAPRTKVFRGIKEAETLADSVTQGKVKASEPIDADTGTDDTKTPF